MFILNEVLKAVDGQLICEKISNFSQVGTDTRDDLSGKIFIALKGDNFDAHNFLEKACGAKAALLIIHDKHKITDNLKKQVTIILVKDTLAALQGLALFWRRKIDIPIIAITGSNGKTTTKEFLAEILKAKYSVAFNKGSLNNHWGVPLNIFTAQKSNDVLIAEMGMNHLGEIKSLCSIAEPNFTLVNNVGLAHVGEMGSIEEVAKAKEEIYEYCKASVGIFNLDNKYTEKMYNKYNSILPKVFSFSSQSKTNADVFFSLEKVNFNKMKFSGKISGVSGKAEVEIFGAHNLYNLMAAATLALAYGMKPKYIWLAISNCKTSWGRNQIIKEKGRPSIIFDAYNSNPDSVSELIKNCNQVEIKGRKFIILGEMLELGEFSKQFHYELGRKVAMSNVDQIWFIGLSNGHFEAGFDSFENDKKLVISDTYDEKLAIELNSVLQPEDIVFIKGSRGSKLERVLTAWNIRN